MSITVTQTQTRGTRQQPVLHLSLRVQTTTQTATREERLALLIREINSHNSFGMPEREIANQAVAERTTEQAATYIFLEIIGPAAGRPNLRNLYTKAKALSEECEEEELNAEEQEVVMEAVAQGVTNTIAYLEHWQEELAQQVEREMDERDRLIDEVGGRAREAIHQAQATAEDIPSIADRLDAHETQFKAQLSRLGQLDQSLQQRRKRHV